jgi:hypothetical protein
VNYKKQWFYNLKRYIYKEKNILIV